MEMSNETIEKLRIHLELDSQTSSKPPSTDLLRKSEKAKEEGEKARRPGGQKGHEGKTRKAEMLNPVTKLYI